MSLIKELNEIVAVIGFKVIESSLNLYHVSPKSFDEFKQQYRSGGPLASDLGFHFGTKETSNNITDHLQKEGKWEPGAPLYEYNVELDVNNPMELEENRLGSWSGTSIVQEIMEKEPRIEGITEKMVDDYYNDEVFFKDGNEWWQEESYDEKILNKAIVKWLGELGYDSIKYHNSYEGGGDSYIVFDPTKIKILNKKEL